MNNYPAVSNDERIQLCYEVLRDDGQSHNMAEILSHRQAPGIKTDTILTSGWGSNPGFEDDPMGQLMYRMAKRKAEKAGVSIQGKRYMSGLATEPLDPGAWVSSGDGFQGDVKRIAAAKGLKVTGAINYTPADYDDHPGCADADAPYKVSEKLVSERVEDLCGDNPELAPTPREKADLHERVREQLSPDYNSVRLPGE